MNDAWHQSEDLVRNLLGIMEGLSQLKDLDALLDQVLLQARRLTNADAGSIFTVENRVLRFSYIHNDSLFSAESSNKYIFVNQTLPIDDQSLAGFVALSGEPLTIDDATAYDYNQSFNFTQTPSPPMHLKLHGTSPDADARIVVTQTVAYSTCYMCACRCGIKVHLKDGRVRYIQGNREHPVNKGVLCAKGSAGIMQHYSPARLRKPLLRVGERGAGEFREIEWDEALVDAGALGTTWSDDDEAQVDEIFRFNFGGARVSERLHFECLF